MNHRASRIVITTSAALLFTMQAMLLTGCTSEAADSSGRAAPAQTSDERASADAANTADATLIARRYTVLGMDCTGCESAVSDALTKLAGVVSCDASYEGEYAIVRMTDDADEAAIIEKVTKLGYFIEPAGE